MTQENDIVLIYLEDKPMTFARIEEITADHKPNWFHVKLMMLQVPLQVVSWILKDVYINGDEYTMGGQRMRLERVECPDTLEGDADDQDEDENGDREIQEKEKTETAPASEGESKVISFMDRKKR